MLYGHPPNTDTPLQSNPASQTPASYGHLIITDSLLCPWGGKKPLTYSLNSTRLIRHPINMDTS